MRRVVGESSLPLYRMMRYHLGWEDEGGDPARGGGKGLRSALCLLACEAVGGAAPRALPAAAALELVHNFSLIHDDIEDGSANRRGRPTVWKLWGVPHAVNAGDAMLVLAQRALLALSSRGLAPERVNRASEALETACLRLCQGQFLDLDFEGRPQVSLEDYLEMIEGKSGALMGCALELGALAGDAPEETSRSLGAWGRRLGCAFQMQDDFLGLWGNEKETGKSARDDLMRKKKSLPVVLALGQPGDSGARLRALYRQESLSPEETEMARGLIEDLGARSLAQAKTQASLEQALADLPTLPLRPGPAAELQEVALFLVNRKS